MKTRSLMFQLSILIVIISTLVLVGFGFYQYQLEYGELTKQLDDSLSITADRLSIGLATPLFNFDEGTIESILMSEMKNPVVVGLVVQEPWGSKITYSYARTEDKGVFAVDDFIPKKQHLTTSREIIHAGEELGKIQVSMTTSFMEKYLLEELTSNIAQIFILDFLLIVLVILLLRSKVINPLTQLKTVSSEIAKGNLEVKSDIKSSDEIGELASSFNQMTLDLKKSQKELQKHSKNLEKEVKERTGQLNQKVEELERFNKIAIDRELKMIELKKKIKELEGKG